jgi:cold shock CspA family protein
VLAKLHSISGIAKVGKTLKTTIPFFNSPNGYSASTFQWYSCGAKMFVHFNDIPTPGVCNPIPGATNMSYKIRKQDKGYYIAVAAANHNTVGSTTVLSNATGKVK